MISRDSDIYSVDSQALAVQQINDDRNIHQGLDAALISKTYNAFHAEPIDIQHDNQQFVLSNNWNRKPSDPNQHRKSSFHKKNGNKKMLVTIKDATIFEPSCMDDNMNMGMNYDNNGRGDSF